MPKPLRFTPTFVGDDAVLIQEVVEKVRKDVNDPSYPLVRALVWLARKELGKQ